MSPTLLCRVFLPQFFLSAGLQFDLRTLKAQSVPFVILFLFLAFAAKALLVSIFSTAATAPLAKRLKPADGQEHGVGATSREGAHLRSPGAGMEAHCAGCTGAREENWVCLERELQYEQGFVASTF